MKQTKQEEGINILNLWHRLWEKRLFILVVTIISSILGIGVVHYIPRNYLATGMLRLSTKNNAEAIHLSTFIPPEVLLTGGEIDLEKVAKQKGQDSVVYIFTDNEQNFLCSERKHIYIKLIGNELQMSAITSDTSNIRNVFSEMQILFKKYIFKLQQDEAFLNYNEIRDSSDNERIALEKRLAELISFRQKNKGDLSLPVLIKEKLMSDEYDLYFSFYANSLQELGQAEKKLTWSPEFKYTIDIHSDITQLSRKSVFMRFLFFGFFISVVWVLGAHFFRREYLKLFFEKNNRL